MVAMLVVIAAPLSAEGRHDDDFSMPLREQETIRKSFTGAHKLLAVDNIFGSIEVVGGQSNQVEIVVTKTLRAESKERLEAAKKEVTLDITDQPDVLKLYVNGPFRCNCDCDGGCNQGCGWHGDQGYQVKFDFQIQVPRNIDLKLRTVNSGHVNVRDVIGNFAVSNVNGGAARAKTVNGGVKVVFRENPKENSEFGTINGPVDLYFARDLSADFRFKTMNGHIYTDFPMTSLAARPARAENQGGDRGCENGRSRDPHAHKCSAHRAGT
jgi:hypothetical protein